MYVDMSCDIKGYTLERGCIMCNISFLNLYSSLKLYLLMYMQASTPSLFPTLSMEITKKLNLTME